MAHFMGVGGAAKLIANAEDNPQASGARLFPNAAAANRSIFYDRDGRARSVYEVYANLMSRYASAANSPATQTALAMYGATPVVAVASSAPATAPVAIDNAAYLSTFPDTRTAPPVTVASASAATDTSPGAPVFHSLFQADANAQPVSSTVRALWGNSSSLTSAAGANPNGGAARPLDLFSDRNGTFSS
jgi:hypothetical protein